jgi:hypothetical protein
MAEKKLLHPELNQKINEILSGPPQLPEVLLQGPLVDMDKEFRKLVADLPKLPNLN